MCLGEGLVRNLLQMMILKIRRWGWRMRAMVIENTPAVQGDPRAVDLDWAPIRGNLEAR